MTRTEPAWWSEARQLAAQGYGPCEIGRRCGVSSSAVTKALNPERYREIGRLDNARRRPAKRAWDREYARRPDIRGNCVRCGDLMGIAKRRGEPGVCAACREAIKEERWREIQRLWAEGLLIREIAEHIGISFDHQRVEIDRMRKAGWDLPYRYARSARGVAAA